MNDGEDRSKANQHRESMEDYHPWFFDVWYILFLHLQYLVFVPDF